MSVTVASSELCPASAVPVSAGVRNMEEKIPPYYRKFKRGEEGEYSAEITISEIIKNYKSTTKIMSLHFISLFSRFFNSLFSIYIFCLYFSNFLADIEHSRSYFYSKLFSVRGMIKDLLY